MKLKFIISIAICFLMTKQIASPPFDPVNGLASSPSSDVLGSYLRRTLNDDLAQLNLLDRSFKVPKHRANNNSGNKKKAHKKVKAENNADRRLYDDFANGGSGGAGFLGGMSGGGSDSNGMGSMQSMMGDQQASVAASINRMQNILLSVGHTKERLLKQLEPVMNYILMTNFQKRKRQQRLAASNAASAMWNSQGTNNVSSGNNQSVNNSNNSGNTPPHNNNGPNATNNPKGGEDANEARRMRYLYDMQPNVHEFGQLSPQDREFGTLVPPTNGNNGEANLSDEQNLNDAFATEFGKTVV